MSTNSASRRSNGLPALRRKLLPASLISLLGLFACGGEAWGAGHVAANSTPTGGAIVGGSGSIAQSGLNTTVVQQSQLLALNWQSFNVGANASVIFKQPSFTSVALNRILDQNPSQIFGHVSANGQLFLINTHGIIFGSSAQMNVGGLVASTLDLTPSDFLANHFNLDAHGGSAGIVNHGTIEAASGGSVSLVGGQVQNDGLIIANYGHINLDGADRAVLDFDGDGLINVQVTGALQKRLTADEAAVTNKGKLQADSGTVVLQASAAKALFTDLVNNTGVVSAGGISTRGGKVQLIASGGNAVTSGSIDVSGTQGGSVQVLSDQNVAVTGTIDASGTQGGGSIRVGGGYQGGEGLQTSNAVYVGPAATLNADATQTGNGGSVVVWGNQVNNFYGSISARGGAQGGNGGLVETSSHAGLNAQGSVDASAPHGAAGTWLLDPYAVTISSGTTANMSTGGSTGNVTYTANGSSSVINVNTIDAALTGGTNVFVFTNTAANGTGTGNITLNNAITAAGAGSLYLQAVGSILLNANIKGDGTDPLNVYLWANYGGAAQGTSYVSNAACTTCQVVIGSTSSSTINTDGGLLDIRTGDATNAGGSVEFGSSGTHGASIDAGALTVNANGITQSSAGSGVSATDVTLNGGNGAINFANSGNDVSGTLTLSNTGAGNNITIDNGTDALTLGTVSMGGNGNLSVSAGGGITLDNDIAITGTQTYGDTVTLGASVITLTGSAVNLQDGISGGNNSLAIDGNASLSGSSSSLGSLSVTGATALSSGVTTGGDQSYSGLVTLGASTVTLGSTGGTVVLTGGVSGAGDALTVNGTGAFGGTSTLKSLTVGGTAEMYGGTITTTGTQLYNGQLILNGSTTLNSSGASGGMTFAGTINSGMTAQSLTINAAANTVDFKQSVGGFNALSSLSSIGSGTVKLEGAAVTTSGTQSYTGQVQTTASALNLSGSTVTASNGFSGSATNLSITGNASIAGTSTLGALSVSGTSALDGSVTTTGTQSYTGAMTLGGDTTLTGSTITAAGITGSTDALKFVGNAVLNGAIDTKTLTASGGTTQLNAGVTTSGAQSYGAVTLGNDVTLDSTGGNVGFSSTIDNASSTQRALTVDAAGGLVSFAGAVGGGSNGALAALTTQSETFGTNASSTLNIGAGGLSISTTGGDITQNAAFTVAGSADFNAGANAIDLNLGNAFTGAVSLSNSGANNVALNNGGALVLGNVSVGSGALNVTGVGISQATDNTITQASGAGATTFNAGSGALSLTNGGNRFTAAVNLTGDVTQINSDGALVLGTLNTGNLTASSGSTLNLGSGTVSGQLAASSNGAMSEGSGGLNVTGAAIFTQNSTIAGNTQNIVLGSTGNDFQSSVTFDAGPGAQIHNLSFANAATTPNVLMLPASVSGNLTLDDTQAALVLPSIQVGGNLIATSNGPLTQSGALSVGGTSQFNAAGNAITLTDNGNAFGGAVSLTGGITQITNGASTLTLGTLDTGDLTVTSGGALDLGSGTVNGALTANSSGAMTQDGALTVTGAATFTQNDTNAGTGQDILLGSAGNQFENTVAFVAGGGAINNLSLTNAYATPGALTLPSGVTGNLTLVYSGAGATLSVPTTTVAGTLDLTAAGGITLDGSETTGGGQIYRSDVTLGTDATLSSTGNGAIEFVSGVTGPYTLTLSTGGDVLFDGLVSLTGLNSTSSTFTAGALGIGAGGLSVTTTGGAISQTGAFVVTGSSSFNAGSNAITLTNGGNSFAGAVALTGGTTKISQGSALTLGALNTGSLTVTSTGDLNLGAGTINGTLTATSNNGAINQTGALNVTGASDIDAGTNTITLTSANTFGGAVSLTGAGTQIASGASTLTLGTLATGDLTAVSGGALDLGSGNIGGTLAASSNGAMTQSGALIVTGAASFTQNNVTAGSGQDILLDRTGNKFESSVAFGAGTGAQINNLTLTNSVASPSAPTLPAAISGNLTLDYTDAALTVPGNISIGGALNVTAANGITIDGNEITGGGQTYNSAVTLGADATLQGGGDIDFAATVSGTHTLTLDTSGAVTLGGAATLAGFSSTSSTFTAGTLGIGSGGLSVTTTAGAISQTGAFTVTGTSSFNAGSNAITLTDNGNAFTGAVSLTGGTTKISQGSALTLGVLHTGSLTATSTGSLNLGSGSVAGDLKATSNGSAIGESGALSVSGTSTIDAGNAAITLTNGGNAFGGAVSLTGGVTQIADAAALNLGTLSTRALSASSTGNLNLGRGTINGNLVASSGGTIGQSGALSIAGTSTLSAGSGAITLTNSGNVFTGAVTATGAGVLLNDSGDLTVAALTDTGNGSVSLTAGGTLTAYGISAGSGDISLASNGGTLSTGGAISGGNISLTGLNGIASSNSITASGTLSMNSAQGGISSTGGISAGALTGSSDGATTLSGSNAIGTLGAFSANGFSLSNGQSLTVNGPVNGNTGTAITVTSGDLALNSGVSGTDTALSAAGAITEGGSGAITASTLTGGAGGAVSLNGANQVGELGNFSAARFSLVDGQGLTVSGTLSGGAGASLTTRGGDLVIHGAISGTDTELVSAGVIDEDGGRMTAGTLSGSAAGAATLTGANQIGALGDFSAHGLTFTDGQSLTIHGDVNGNGSTSITTDAGNIAINGNVSGNTVALYSAGGISEGGGGVNAGALTGSSAGATTLNGINQVGTLGNFSANGFGLTDAQSLTVAGPVNAGGSLSLTSTGGDLSLNAAVSGAVTSLNAAGALNEGSGGVITASTLSGNAGGVTSLTGANKVDTLGDFRSPAGFDFANDQTLTLSALNGSNYAVNAGTSALSISVTNGSLFQADHAWNYDGTGSWSSTGSIGTQANPIYVLGTTTQYVPLVGNPPAYFYGVDAAGAILPIVGDSVNIPTSLFSSRAQNANNHLDSYIDASVITANYRSFGIVPSGILLPADQQSCQSGGGADCPDE